MTDQAAPMMENPMAMAVPRPAYAHGFTRPATHSEGRSK